MVRTQIYLTKKEFAGLEDLSASSGKSQGQLIREAIDRILAEAGLNGQEADLESVAGT